MRCDECKREFKDEDDVYVRTTCRGTFDTTEDAVINTSPEPISIENLCGHCFN